MREIKVKAFCRSEETLCRVVVLNFEKETIIVDFEGKYTGQYLFEDVELIEYTGLKDKSGVEIYEGDIVKCCDRTGVVIFGRGMFEGEGFGIDEKECLWNLVVDECEVIGNKYENPELLK